MCSKQYIDDQGRTRLRWVCWLCGYELAFHAKDSGYIPFFAVHHLVEQHGLTAEDVSAYDPCLEEEAQVQCQLPAQPRAEIT